MDSRCNYSGVEVILSLTPPTHTFQIVKIRSKLSKATSKIWWYTYVTIFGWKFDLPPPFLSSRSNRWNSFEIQLSDRENVPAHMHEDFWVENRFHPPFPWLLLESDRRNTFGIEFSDLENVFEHIHDDFWVENRFHPPPLPLVSVKSSKFLRNWTQRSRKCNRTCTWRFFCWKIDAPSHRRLSLKNSFEKMNSETPFCRYRVLYPTIFVVNYLQNLQKETECKEETLKTIGKMLQNLVQDLSKDEIDQMMNSLKADKGTSYWEKSFVNFVARRRFIIAFFGRRIAATHSLSDSVPVELLPAIADAARSVDARPAGNSAVAGPSRRAAGCVAFGRR